MKEKINLAYFIPVFLLGIVYLYIMNKRDLNRHETAPKIRFEAGLNKLYITEISFERNDLYLNDTLYNAGGISGYSRVHTNNGLIELSDVEPPFTLTKKANNDTLRISKDDSDYYLLVTTEIKFARGGN
jgi:hypothetical protein